MIPVIISGGSGQRLWPLSREGFPKQFHRLASENSMFQDTVLRLSAEQYSRPIVVCNESHRFIIREQLAGMAMAAEAILLEPCARNTAPAITLAAMQVIARGCDEVMLVSPADHLVRDREAFDRTIAVAKVQAEQGNIVLLGVEPTHPETGFGYIQAERSDRPLQVPAAYAVKSFKEKPDFETAERWLASGEYLWNAGVFVFRASVYLEQIRHFAPEVYAACEKSLKNAEHDFEFVRVAPESFIKSPSISIDHAVMEKTNLAKVVTVASDWNDIGSWSALWKAGEQDSNCNVVSGDAMLHNTKNCLVYSQSRLVATVGLEDLVVVDTPDAVLVMNRDQAQDVKEIVTKLKQKLRPETLNHREVFRPWGSFDSIDSGDRFEVKNVVVKPGEKISKQRHNHRAEHWVVVSGTAEVTCDDKVFLLTENESTYIPIGAVHQLANPGLIPLVVIEIRSGSYLGDDDIHRIEEAVFDIAVGIERDSRQVRSDVADKEKRVAS
ncbi:mannose-1-phosphate guanylyltransferase/mannose-6-phosphate isomerase [Gilvimarinus agarilyticus]|uniref:mannose-1-phosphate guanylyltransferase/mannose-6-phosphate isomerase n=1 Tax=Gilvimarinus agarilyticus TaxID=679259 RepID=UPI0006970E8B|nr:mannose-1-phosphate guanylyltransferase/mannose-6-phosphate isomerase [Gilvimarinus agarilyticus]